MAPPSPLLEVRNLIAGVSTAAGRIPILKDVSLSVARGEVLGIVGESGAGKSMLGISVMGLLDPPVSIFEGEVFLEGANLLTLGERGLRRLRGSRIAMVFQDPMTTLSPTHRIGTVLTDILRAHRRLSRRQARAIAAAALRDVGIPSPEERLDAYRRGQIDSSACTPARNAWQD